MFPPCSAHERRTSSPTGVGSLLIVIFALTPRAEAQELQREAAAANERDRERVEAVANEQAAKAAAEAKALDEKKRAQDQLKKAKVRAAFQAFFKNAVNAVGGRPGPVGVQIQVNNAQLRQFEQQYKRHFDQIVATELHFIRVVCRPTKQEFELIAADCENVRKETIQHLAVQRQNPGRGMFSNTNPRASIANGLVKSVKRRLSADQARRYETQVAQRHEARKRVALMNLVATVDRKLVLTTKQRDKLTKVLSDNWQDSWAHTQKLLYAENYFPNVPRQLITPILSDAQKKALLRYSNRSVNFGIDVSMIHGVAIPEEQWDDPMESIDEGQAK